MSQTPTAILTILMLIVSIAGCGESPGTGSTVRDPNSTLVESRDESIVARVGPILEIGVGQTAMLSDNNSSTTSPEPLRFLWAFSSRPDGSNAVLQGSNSTNPSFVADVKGTYRVQLVVNAGSMTSKRAVQLVLVTDATDPAHVNHKGLSSTCLNCHSNELDLASATGKIPGKSGNHVATSSACETCHTPLAFAIVPFVDHQEVFGNCSGCHDGVTAVGKSEFHTPTEAECDSCHNTIAFFELEADGSFDHTGIISGCAGCHNGTTALGMTPTVNDDPPGTHPDTVADCVDCHNTTDFADAYPDHNGPLVVGKRCDSCHGNGAGSSASGEPPGHPVMAIDCQSCHGIVTFSLGGVFNHRIDPLVQSCDTCHNDNSSTNFNGLAPGKATAVSPTAVLAHQGNSSDCGSCHFTDSFAPAFGFDHTGITADCATSGCHTGLPGEASGKHTNHLPTAEDCSVCHTPGTFTTGVFTHDPVYLVANPALGLTGACTDCHDNVIGVGKLPNHFPTDLGIDQNCEDCHYDAAAVSPDPTVFFTGATFDHAGIGTNTCGQCHNGDYETTANTLYGKPATHLPIPVTASWPNGQDCNVCHSVAASFAPATNFAHLDINDNCESCHNGNPNYVAVGALDKTPNHIPAVEQCVDCHVDKNSGGFASNTFFPAQHDLITSGCEGCHVSRFFPAEPELSALTKTASHVPTAQDCDVCHNVNGFTPTTMLAHEGISGNCASCHNGDFTTVGTVGARAMTPTVNDTPPGTHPATVADCVSCHDTTDFANASVDHSSPDVLALRCDSCHDGAQPPARGKNAIANHVVTTEDCGVCHTAGGNFKPAVFDHTGITDNCASCHDGVIATGTAAKTNPSHIPIPIVNGVEQDCSVCHVTTEFANARFDHQGIVGNCASCHDGFTATGKTNFHVPTNDDCSVCHVTTGFKPATFDHVGIVDNCASCHDAGFATPKDAGHVATSQDCGICHNTSGFFPATFDHTGIVNGCVNCHDGNTATGKVDAVPAHIEPADQDCYFCHTTATFAGGTWVHDSSTANNCLSCHDDGGRATTKSSGHLNTTDQCDVCHTTDRWAPTSFSHASNSEFTKQKLGTHRRDPGCNGCHGTKIGSRPDGIEWLPSRAPQYAPFCAACHANDFRREGDHRGGSNGTIEQNKGCGDSGCHRVSSSGF
ncbi:MAG: hypothetical protein LJE92_09545 [Gammaproteobacteria bacterium]|jgi:hypothetical protein|nr:hypothetical protein [Gammaproteobacteria bacterium]